MPAPQAHSSFGPSSWSRAVRCPGSVKFAAQFDDTAGFPAAEGTAFHRLMAACLSLGLEPENFKGGKNKSDGFVIEYNDEMFESAKEGLEYIRVLEQDPDWEMFVETRVDISPWTLPGQFGTADVVFINVKERKIIVFDWKYGKEPVYAPENYQAQGYCLGAWQTLCGERFDWDPSNIEVSIIIEQPRVPGAGGLWKTTMQRVLEFGKHVRRQAILSTQDEAPIVPGKEQCRWCPARFECDARAQWHLENMGMSKSDLDDMLGEPEPSWLPKVLTTEHRSLLIELAPQIKAWLQELHDAAKRDAEIGLEVPRWKLAEGRRQKRAYKDTAVYKAEMILIRELGPRKAYAEPELLSPAQAEKALGRKRYKESLARYVKEGERIPQLVPAEDGRREIQSAMDVLAEEPETDENHVKYGIL